MPERRLAAIMFTDMVGYTQLMGSDEKLAFHLLEKNRKLHQYLIGKYHGNLIKEIGDSILACFPSAYDTILCACEIIEATRDDQELSLKLGIHTGDVVFRDHDVFGENFDFEN